MFSALNLLLVTTASSVVMLFVLFSLVRSGVAGVKEWFTANALAIAALLLFAARGVAPAFLSIEIANALMLSASAMMYIGFRRHFSRPIPMKLLIAGATLVLGAVATFDYGFDSIALRTVAVSIFHGAVCFAIGVTVLQAPNTSRPRYPSLFTANVAMLLAFGHVVRGIVYAVKVGVPLAFLEPTGLNLFFFSLGTLALPGLTLGAVMTVNDAILAQAEHAANRDFLTGAWSRRAFFEFAERERARVVRMGRKLSLLVFDVDHFKRINDTYGHAVGDQVLVDIVLRTETVIRSIDYCARLGGEEFAVLLPEVDGASAAFVGERLRAALERPASVGISTAGPIPNVAYSVSIGVATLEDGESVTDLIRRADAALYTAKTCGRNAVVVSAGTEQMQEVS